MTSTRELVGRLMRPDAFPHPVDSVETLETHISHLVFAGEHVYKLKKSVDLGFLDFSTPERRLHFCCEEVRLNRRLAPDVYLDVVPVVRTDDGRILVDGEGTIVEHAVHMRRLPASRMMDALLERGEIDNSGLRALAALLARFHAAAETGPGVDEHGTPEAVGRLMLENFSETEPWVDRSPAAPHPQFRLVGGALHDHLRDWTVRALDALRDVMERRVREHRIRDGHGDLHAGNICFEGEEVVAYDCIEFSRAFRCGDVACDLAFLAMDLDNRSFRGMSAFLVDAYARSTGDATLPEVIRPYKLYRAMVRAKVGIMLAAQLADAGASEAAVGARRQAAGYLHLAATYTLPPPLIVMCGLPASGKSYTGKRVAVPFEAALLRSDVVRKRMFGIEPTDRVPAERIEEVYGPDANDRTFAALEERARHWLGCGRPVVVDAVFGTRTTRAAFVMLAKDLGVPLLLVQVITPEETTLERLAARAVEGGSVSDADVAVYEKIRDGFEPPDELEHRLVLDGRDDPGDQVEAVLTALAAMTAS